MPKFSNTSAAKLATCHPSLQRVLNEVVRHFDCAVIEGHRTIERQKQLLAAGASQTEHSKHLSNPSMAVDAAPYPVDWSDTARFYYFAGFVLGVAASMGIKIRWGGDWDQDTQVANNNFDDLVHFEIAG